MVVALIVSMNQPDTRLVDASRDCRAGIRGDNNRSLSLDMIGEDPVSGLDTFADVECVLHQLDVPDSVYQKMVTTTSLAGRQTDSWDGIDASWTYHPSNGLDVILELKD